MIVIYPLLTSTSISQNITPAVAKIVEHFILLYRMKDVIDTVKYFSGAEIKMGLPDSKKSAKKMRGGEGTSESFYVQEDTELRPGTISGSAPSGGGVLDRFSSDVEKFHMSGVNIKIGSTDILQPNMSSLTIEPTWVKVGSGITTQILGIKVIPFPIKSEIGLAKMMQDESKMKLVERILVGMSRRTQKLVWSAIRGLKIPGIASRALTGDPQQDILWGSTKFKNNVFLMVNYSDITDERFFGDARNIQNLFTSGWNSFIAADDVNKRGIFCMKEFKGLCSTLPYQYMISSLGQQHVNVYKDLEDMKKASSPFFKLRRPIKKLFEIENSGNDYLLNKLDYYKK